MGARNAIGFASRLVRMSRADRRITALSEVEAWCRLASGKGYGSHSVDQETRLVLEFCKQLGISKIVGLDIGANKGTWTQSLLEKEPSAQIVCFEPSKASFKSLENRFSNDDRVTLENIALASQNGERNLYFDTPGSGLASLTKRKLDHFEIKFDLAEVVETRTLDSYSRDLALAPNVLKLDVEGHELEVLKGGVQTLQNVSICQFEFGGCNIDTRTFWQDFWYFFTSNGFALHRISKQGPIPIRKYLESDECFLTTNFIAVKI